jgi:hypothetical protein
MNKATESLAGIANNLAAYLTTKDKKLETKIILVIKKIWLFIYILGTS